MPARKWHHVRCNENISTGTLNDSPNQNFGKCQRGETAVLTFLSMACTSRARSKNKFLKIACHWKSGHITTTTIHCAPGVHFRLNFNRIITRACLVDCLSQTAWKNFTLNGEYINLLLPLGRLPVVWPFAAKPLPLFWTMQLAKFSAANSARQNSSCPN